MGGFTINGCGASDSYYPLKELTGKTCPQCGKANMSLMELRMKIRVFYIPTFTIGKKYGILCPKCKQGYYVSDEQRDYVMSHGAACVNLLADGIQIVPVEEDAVLPEEKPVLPDDAAAVPAEAVPAAAEAVPAKPVEPARDVEIAAPVADPRAEAASEAPLTFVYKKSKVCPDCGMHATADKEVCGVCGARLE